VDDLLRGVKPDQPFDLGCLLVGVDMDIKVYPILSDLVLGIIYGRNRAS
jgi:hypothetical protein